MNIDLDATENFTVLKGHFMQVTAVGEKMVLFKFNSISSYGRLIIQGLTFVGVYEEMLEALKAGDEVTLVGQLRLYKNKHNQQYEVQLEATNVLYPDYSVEG